MTIETYYRVLRTVHEADFVQACDRILWDDDWFPTIARLRAVTEQCGIDREAEQRARRLATGKQDGDGGRLVCATCRGARWMRTGKPSPLAAAGDDQLDQMQIKPCPDCMVQGQYDPAYEQRMMDQFGGVIIEPGRPSKPADITAKLAPFRTAEGGIDIDALYRHSRELRGLDPNIDERPGPVPGWQSIGQIGIGE